MERRVTHDGRPLVIDDSAAPDATIRDLADLLGAHQGVVVDGLPVDDTESLDRSVFNGSRVDTAGCSTGGETVRGFAIGVATGPDAGRLLAVAPGGTIVGRSAFDDPTVATSHCTLHATPGGLTVTAEPSHNGVRIGGTRLDGGARPVAEYGLAWLGATAITAVSACDDTPDPVVVALARTGDGRIAAHRPPRPARGNPRPLPVPPTTERAPLAPAAGAAFRLIAPLLSALVLAVVFDPRFAVIGLIGPLGNLAAAGSQRRRTRRQNRLTAAEQRRALAVFCDELRYARDLTGADRRAATPHLPEIVRRASHGSARLWERRPSHDDFLRVVVGHGDEAWDPGLQADAVPEAHEIASRAGVLVDVPITVDLEHVIGIVGPRRLTVPLARSLLTQAAVLHGPADIAVTVAAIAEHRSDWAWTTWLPHLGDPSRPRLFDERSEIRLVDEAVDDSTRHLIVVDGDALLHGRDKPLRAELSTEGRSGLVVATDVSRLPSSCRTVVEIADTFGRFRIVEIGGAGSRVRSAVASGVSVETATRVARSLARYVDPEQRQAGAALPASASLVAALGEPTPDAIRRCWATSSVTSLPVTIGVDSHGVVEIDLVTDGPHAVVGGTTGSGKSELLRTLVAGLAAAHPPEHVAFVLVDYKGGSAFDRCVGLPHVVGLVTDLDGDMTSRVRDGLSAEIRRREHLLREHGCDDLASYTAQRISRPESPPLPRLVVVVDEVATLLAEQPAFLDALVDVAQRGRSLGFHLVLATQRPAGAIRESVLANVNLRIALRTADGNDSRTVLGVADAADISRLTPGRAVIRSGPGELRPVQTARVTAVTPATASGLRIRWVDAGPDNDAVDAGPTDLERIVAATSAIATGDPMAPLWLAPLPDRLDLADVLGEATATACRAISCTGADVAPGRLAVVLGRADRPNVPDQVPLVWECESGPLLVVGSLGTGATSALRTVARSLAASQTPDRLHLYVVGADAGLDDLGSLPHVGAVAGPADPAHLRRVLHLLGRELDERRQTRDPDRPHIVVLIDDGVSLVADLESSRDHRALEIVRRLAADGTSLGVHTAVAVTRANAPAATLWRSCTNRLVLGTADPTERLALGLRPDAAPGRPPGRATIGSTAVEAQVAWVEPGESRGLRVRSRCVGRGPRQVSPAPALVSAGDLRSGVKLEGVEEPWVVPIGIDEMTLEPVALTLDPGSHALVIGPPHSGRTALLRAIRSLAGDRAVVIAGRLRAWFGEDVVDGRDHDAVTAALRAATDSLLPVLLLVDDADHVNDPDGSIERLISHGDPNVRIVAATRPDRLRGGMRHWTTEVRRHRTGVMLDPEDHDGDLLGARLTPDLDRAGSRLGRGVLVTEGVAHRARLAQLSTRPTSGANHG